MFDLKKCKRVACTRHGSVALTQGAEFCNIHSQKEKPEEKGEEKEEEKVE